MDYLSYKKIIKSKNNIDLNNIENNKYENELIKIKRQLADIESGLSKMKIEGFFIFYNIFHDILISDFRKYKQEEFKSLYLDKIILAKKYYGFDDHYSRYNKSWKDYFKRRINESMITICYEDIEIYRYLVKYAYLLSWIKPAGGSADPGIRIFDIFKNRNLKLASKFASWVLKKY